MKKIAILSDIHSNSFALEAVLRDMSQEGITRMIVLGDIFGYYPWAVETSRLLNPFLGESHFIRGNHDQLLLQEIPPSPVPVYWDAAKQNERELRAAFPEALTWLQSLPEDLRFNWGNHIVRAFHGTPADHLNGRFYPDQVKDEGWFPAPEEIILLGHTHYPLVRGGKQGQGLIFNPGSVGQPRDGNPMPAWGVIDPLTLQVEHRRSVYNQHQAMDILRGMNWNNRAILALNKTNTGTLSD